MPLKLVTGPANSGKAGVVLGAYRARLDEDPILVVPAFRDVEHALRELAESGAVFGARVVRFSRLFEEIARRAGYAARRASGVQRELIAARAARHAGLSALASSAERPGFTRAAVRFFAELERSMVEPDRLSRALADRAVSPGARHAGEVAALYSRYRDGLEAAGLVDAELFAWRALDALRGEPGRWGRTPVFVYGFDDFTPLELAAIETLARPAGADVTVSLPYEDGRVAFRAVAGAFERLAALADDHVALEASGEHYAEPSREALHQLERGLFGGPPEPARPGGPPGASRRVDPGAAIRLHSAGGERAEVELAGAEVLRLLRAGTEPGEVAVVFRHPTRYASVVEQVLGAYGIPFSIDRHVPLSHTALGRALLALMRCAVLGGTDDDLLAYLRATGMLEEPRLADELEAAARRRAVDTAAGARRLWERAPGRPGLEGLDRLRGADGAAGLLAELEAQLERLFSVPYRRRARVLSGEELEDPRVYETVRAALRDVRELVVADPDAALDRRWLHDTLAALPVRLGEAPRPDRVQVASPEAIRARRFDAVLVCGLQEGELPRRSLPEPFLPDDERRALAAAGDVALPLREDELDRERYLFYVCASRAERVLVLSCRTSDEEGRPQAPSFFVEDVKELFSESLARGTVRRSLSEVTWPPELAPTEVEWERAAALAAPRRPAEPPEGLSLPAVRERLAAIDLLSATALETFAACPVRWLVEWLIEAGTLDPDPEPLVRGGWVHDALRRTYERVREETGSRRVTSADLDHAERIAVEAVKETLPAGARSWRPGRALAVAHRLEADLLRYLRHETESDGSFEPEHLELAFGFEEEEEGDGLPPLELGGVRIRGRIDRVDTCGGRALVLDYKGGSKGYPGAKWLEENRLQVALYMLAVRELLGLELAGGAYVPLGSDDLRPRGLLAAESREELGSGFVRTDWSEEADFEERLAGARAAILALVRRLREGDVRPTPDTCAWDGGCSYPSICRLER